MSTRRRKPTQMREPVQARSKKKKEAILQAAVRLFNQFDESEITIPRIAKAAKVSVGTTYSYYKDKREIFLHVLTNIDHRLVDRFQAQSLDRADLERFMFNGVSYLLDYFKENEKRSRNFRKLSSIDGDFLDITVKTDKEGVDIIKSLLLLTGKKKGRETDLRAFAIYRMIHGSTQLNYLFDYRFEKKELATTLCELFFKCID